MMELKTNAFADQGNIPDRCTKDYEDLSPDLQWSAVPSGTVEFAMSCVDPDAPAGTWVHWLVAGIDPQITSCDEGKPPSGSVEGINNFGNIGYNGPQPPREDGPHRYFFNIHALNRPLDLDEGFTHEDLQRGLAEAEIGTGTVVGTYERR